jgi:hypothetical protein
MAIIPGWIEETDTDWGLAAVALAPPHASPRLRSRLPQAYPSLLNAILEPNIAPLTETAPRSPLHPDLDQRAGDPLSSCFARGLSAILRGVPGRSCERRALIQAGTNPKRAQELVDEVKARKRHLIGASREENY